MNTAEKVRENRYRRWAKRLGLNLRKDRARHFSLRHRGGYMIVTEYRDNVILGADYDLSLDDVEEFLQKQEQELSSV